MNSRYAIVAIGYNRTDGLLRLLKSVENAYFDEEVTLIISIDNSGNDAVEKAAKAFSWTHGEKIVRTFPTRQGLKKHILQCGEYLDTFDAIAVLEDDLVVSPAFYSYMKQAVSFYKKDKNVAGISLYSHKTNVNSYTPFQPAYGSADVFFLQFAQSWGQIWMKEQWKAFVEWYEKNKDTPIAAPEMPTYVSGWNDNSWLKYHIKYCVDTNKLFVYPYVSLTTCFSDAGEHSKESNAVFQVPLMSERDKHYKFETLENSSYKYDVFFERMGLGKALGVKDEELVVDLYGTKNTYAEKKYVLTRKTLPYKIISQYALAMRPHENNVIYGIKGNELYLYDCTVADTHKADGLQKEYVHVSYYYNITAQWKSIASYFITRICRKILK